MSQPIELSSWERVQSLFYYQNIEKINMAKLLKKEVNSNTSEILMVGIYSVLEGDLETSFLTRLVSREGILFFLAKY
jgi:hypothetical protein